MMSKEGNVMSTLSLLFKTMRPRQWTKNLVVFAPLIFSEKQLLWKPMAWLCSIGGFILFSCISGAVYIMNDLVDLEHDRIHPEKRNRPLASGTLSVSVARFALLFLFAFSMGASLFMPPLFAGSAVAYFAANIAYSFKLKNVVILDVLTIAIGFVLRAQAGVGAIQMIDPAVYISHWLILCTLMLALFLGMAKRRQELQQLREGAASHRKILSEYSAHFLDEMTGIVSSITIISYALYTVSAETILKYGTDKLVYTVPFVLYGIFRYMYLIHMRNQGDNPSEILLSDRPLQITILLWLVSVVAIIHLSG
ncbi:MAG: decaprenyl-phosphate phosphoribosyltransferase [Candidatus Riflebacteria bacterium]|nr:decaprenyl-phosphate phosphoribosyltransferase [Candidatus Riflebacteria bacterium]